MNTENTSPNFSICILEEQAQYTLADLCDACAIDTQQIFELVEIGILEPQGRKPEHWMFGGNTLQRARKAMRLQADLELNLAGVALVMELLDENESLRTRLWVLAGE